jgi:valyl-tRNA synthetase
VIVSAEPVTRCPACGHSELRQETDVLDTWFSSALWPFSTMGWPKKTRDLEVFYPTSVLVTGFDILFFWVARMMMMGLKFMGDVPFRDVYIHALVRDAEGQKMSKSRGNVIDPLEVIEKFGTDSFRFTLAAFAAQGRDIRLSEERISGYRNFANKIWNASRFTLTHLQEYDPGKPAGEAQLTLADQWILSRVNQTVAQVREGLDAYKFNEAASAVYQFLWHEFCDWYIELIKPALYQDQDPGRKWLAQNVLARVLDTSLRLLHPFMPFITEEIWQNLPGSEGSIMVAEFPRLRENEIYPREEARMELIMLVIGAIRNLRSEMGIPPGKKAEVILYSPKKETLRFLEENRMYVENLARTEKPGFQSGGQRPKGSATAIVEEVEVFLPLKGWINLEEEEKRLQRELDRVFEDLSEPNGNSESGFREPGPAGSGGKEKGKAEPWPERGQAQREPGRVKGWKKEE